MAKAKRGFAAMDPEKQREISRKGGQASHGGGRKRKSDSTTDMSASGVSGGSGGGASVSVM